MATAARPCLVDSLLPPKRIRDYSGQVNGMTDAQRWRADVGVTFPHTRRCWRQQESDGWWGVSSTVSGQVWLIIAHTRYILTFALIHSHRCKKLIRLLSYYGNKHTNPGFAAIHPFVALCYLLNKMYSYMNLCYIQIYIPRNTIPLSQESTFKKRTLIYTS